MPRSCFGASQTLHVHAHQLCKQQQISSPCPSSPFLQPATVCLILLSWSHGLTSSRSSSHAGQDNRHQQQPLCSAGSRGWQLGLPLLLLHTTAGSGQRGDPQQVGPQPAAAWAGEMRKGCGSRQWACWPRTSVHLTRIPSHPDAVFFLASQLLSSISRDASSFPGKYEVPILLQVVESLIDSAAIRQETKGSSLAPSNSLTCSSKTILWLLCSSPNLHLHSTPRPQEAGVQAASCRHPLQHTGRYTQTPCRSGHLALSACGYYQPSLPS